VERKTGHVYRNFEIRYKGYLHSFRNNNTNSKFAHHLLENGHTFGKMDNVMEIMYFSKKGTHMVTIESFLCIEKSKKEMN
jgi:hypothetical protein